MIDVVTGDSEHFEPSWAGLEAGKHVLCEKPVHHDYHQVVAAADLADSKDLKTKLGFTFRYAPATMYAAELIAQGYVGDIYLMNVFEQNSQWLDPQTPTRGERENSPDYMAVSSIEGYGAPVIDIMHWWMDSPLAVGGRHDAQFRAVPGRPGDRTDDPDQHRRRRHVDRRVRRRQSWRRCSRPT